MLHIIQFSGGAASAYVAYLVAQEQGKENTVLLFHDTKAEHEDADRFRKQVAEYIGVPITEISKELDLWELIEKNKALPSQFMPFCTTELKQKQGEKYIKKLEKEGIEFILYNGFGPDEWRRVQKATVRAEAQGRTVKSPLFERNISNTEVKRIIRDEWKICLPQPYIYLEHNNCIPCFKAGKSHFYKVWKHYPRQFQKAKAMEELTGHTVFKNISLSELEKQWEAAKGQITFEEWENEAIPCMCAI